MKIPPSFARYLFLLIVVAAIVDFIADVKDQSVAAVAVNGKIAFVTNDQTIYTINPDGLGLNQLTPSATGARDRGPDWSPDGTKIVFSMTDRFRRTFQIFVKNIDGTGLTLLARISHKT